MKRILLHLAISIFAFALGVTITATWRYYASLSVPEPYIPNITDELPSPQLAVGGITSACGPNTAYTYFLSNGAKITRICEFYSSADDAMIVMRARRSAGADIISWSSNINSEGTSVGENILFVSGGSAIRLITYGSTLCETRSSSLIDLRWFEEQENHY